MSTVCKLDRNVRLDRYLRKQQLREMQDDLRTVGALINRGHKVAASFNERTTLPARHAHKRLMGDLVLKRTILAMTLDHLTKVFKDPSRTGARKDTIFLKLSSQSQREGKST
jgi:hypothetical protein